MLRDECSDFESPLLDLLLLFSDLWLDLLDFFDELSSLLCFDFLLLFDDRFELLDDDLLVLVSSELFFDLLLLLSEDFLSWLLVFELLLFDELDFLSELDLLSCDLELDSTDEYSVGMSLLPSGSKLLRFGTFIDDGKSLPRGGGLLLDDDDERLSCDFLSRLSSLDRLSLRCDECELE